MSLRVSGKNRAIGDALRTHVHGRIDAVVGKYKAGSPTGHVTIEPEGSGYRADCTLFLKAGITLQVEAIAHEPYASFDKAADRIERRLRDHRKRQMDRHCDAAPAGATQDADLSDVDLSEDEEDTIEPLAAGASEATFPAIVAEHAAGFKEMTVAAAVRTLDETDCPVVVFRYAETRRINLVYRRADGNIGWIDPLDAVNGRSA